jgi:hypothetical protein
VFLVLNVLSEIDPLSCEESELSNADGVTVLPRLLIAISVSNRARWIPCLMIDVVVVKTGLVY